MEQPTALVRLLHPHFIGTHNHPAGDTVLVDAMTAYRLVEERVAEPADEAAKVATLQGGMQWVQLGNPPPKPVEPPKPKPKPREEDSPDYIWIQFTVDTFYVNGTYSVGEKCRVHADHAAQLINDRRAIMVMLQSPEAHQRLRHSRYFRPSRLA